MTAKQGVSGRVRVLHQTPGRLRLRYPRASDPALDAEYLQASLSALPGVRRVRINTRAASVVVRYDGRERTKNRLLATLQSIPEEAFLPHLNPNRGVDPANLVSLGLFTLLSPLLPRKLNTLLSWLVATPVMLSGVEALVNRGLKVELLDASAVAVNLLRRDYFTANAIVTLLALGRYLEQVSDYKSSELLQSLLRPQADLVWIEKDGVEVAVPADELEIGSLVICGPGQMIPVDGEVSRGEASINKSSITGESIPDNVHPGDQVTSGSVVEEGRIIIRARKVGDHTTMARMHRFLQRSVRSKSEPERRMSELADKLVPLSLGLAAAKLAVTRSLGRAASVLTVDYSCVLKLVSPVVIKTSMYTAGREGVLIKGAQALESFAQADTFIFDKTGTLTTGALQVDQVIPLDDLSSDELLALAAGAEEHYRHPVGKAVVREARKKGLTPPTLSQVDFVVAHGVSAYVGGERVLVGSYHFVAEDEGVDCSGAEETALRLRAAGKSILYVAHENHLEGIITLRDQIRPETPRVLRGLKDLGVKQVVVLTGDHRDSARRLARELDMVDRFLWELKPEDKSAVIQDLQNEGRRVAYVGDGVNDAPALVTSDVGVCMPSGADLARESARVVLLTDELDGLVAARSIALESQAILRNSFNATIGLNSAILFLAGMGRLSPFASAVMHNLSTVAILGYATNSSLKSPPAPNGFSREPDGAIASAADEQQGQSLS